MNRNELREEYENDTGTELITRTTESYTEWLEDKILVYANINKCHIDGKDGFCLDDSGRVICKECAGRMDKFDKFATDVFETLSNRE